MPKRIDIGSILVLGAGPIVIGQACEFDYSGAQACKALKAEGYRVILVNSNPATIMTDPELPDATYVEPLTPEFVERIIEKERPDALLPTLGGQTGLNLAMELVRSGILERYGVEMIGADADVIEKAESRQRFREAMERIGIASPRGQIVGSVDEALAALERVGLPAIIRPSFTLGGEGGGVATTRSELIETVERGLALSPVGQVLVEESLLGWKEYEMEVVRDHADNCIIVCSIENVDPMGIHTGDSITVAPALTLTDKEYQRLRNASIACLREIGVDTGGSNVQFAIHPETGRMVIIEMNPRVSRSSALASKATGFPIAKIAAKLAVGYRLDELKNDITQVTPASFEPTIDYVVTKIPRFTFHIYVLEVNPRASRTVPFVAKATSVPVAKIAARVMAGEPLARFGLTEPRLEHVAVKEAVLPFARFPGSDVVLGPEMKSTGESMGIDQDFATAYLKAQLGAGVRLPRSGTVLITVRDADKPGVVDVAQRLARLGFRLFATCGTAEVLRRAEVPVTTVAKVEEGSPNVLDLIDQGEIQLLIDTALWADEIAGGQQLRTRALQRRVPYCSRLSIARAIVDAIERQQDWEPSVRPLQSYAQRHPTLKLFIRQPLTQSGDESKEIVEGVLQIVEEIGKNGVRFEYLTGNTPLSDQTFRENFEQSQGLPFNAANFRRYRLGQLRRADAFLYVRTAMSESGAFEVSYNVFAEPCAPMFFAGGSMPRSRPPSCASSRKSAM